MLPKWADVESSVDIVYGELSKLTVVMKSLTLALLQVEALGAWDRGSLQPHCSVPIGQKSGRNTWAGLAGSFAEPIARTIFRFLGGGLDYSVSSTARFIE